MARIEQGMWLAQIKHHQEAEVMGHALEPPQFPDALGWDI
jgi:hypothetical protein